MSTRRLSSESAKVNIGGANSKHILVHGRACRGDDGVGSVSVISFQSHTDGDLPVSRQQGDTHL